MIRSVKIKMFLHFTLFLAFFLCLSIVINIQFFEEYFIYKNEKGSLSAYAYVNNVYNNEPDAIHSALIDLMVRKDYLGIVVDKKSMDAKFKVEPLENVNHTMIFIRELLDTRTDDIKSGYIYKTIKFPEPVYPPQGPMGSDNEKMEFPPVAYIKECIFIKELDKGDLLILRKPLHVLDQYASILNEFIIYVGIIVILLGSIFVYFFSKKVTQPLIELNDIAKKISKLDFSKKFNVRTKDEIGMLGDSINFISDEFRLAIDGLMEANEELKEDVERKKKIDQMRRNFISSVSHELKSPIGITKGYAEGLKFNVAKNEENRKKYYDILIDEAEKMDKMVKQLLRLSDLESDVFQLEKSVFNMSNLITEVIEKFKPIITEKNINVRKIYEKNFFVYADYLKIEQVVTNYFTNAMNHLNNHKYIEISINHIEGKVRVSVINSGENIPEEDLDNIWDSFYKVDKARSREYGGTGLGLSIVKSIMDHHEEKYGVVNKEIGVEFWFELSACYEK